MLQPTFWASAVSNDNALVVPYYPHKAGRIILPPQNRENLEIINAL